MSELLAAAKGRPRRALLFCPGTERRKIEKAAGLGVDAVIVDLEDAAALSMKAEARAVTAEAVAALDFGRSERLVRINPPATGLAEDDLAITGARASLPDGFVIPKVEGADDVRFVADRLAALEAAAERPRGATGIVAIVESARGVVNLREIAEASERLVALVFGAEDYCADIGARRTAQADEVLWARSAVVAHARAAGLQAIDTPFIDFRDEAGLRADTARALQLGYDGKLAIHPGQVPVILDVLAPTGAELDAARRIIAAHDAAQAEGRGVFEIDGKMVDMPMIRAAERVVARAGAAA